MKALAIISLALLVMLVLFVRARPANVRAIGKLPEPSPDVHALIAHGDPVGAMRRYRQQTGASLMQAESVIRHYGGGSA